MDFNACMNLIHSQKNLPLTTFIIAFLVLAFLEIKFSGYKEKTPRLLRWPNHLLLVCFNALIFRVLLPVFASWQPYRLSPISSVF